MTIKVNGIKVKTCDKIKVNIHDEIKVNRIKTQQNAINRSQLKTRSARRLTTPQTFYFQTYTTTLRKLYSISFQSEWDMIVETVFLSIFWAKWNSICVQNRKENCHHDHIPFNVKGNGNIVLSVFATKSYAPVPSFYIPSYPLFAWL